MSRAKVLLTFLWWRRQKKTWLVLYTALGRKQQTTNQPVRAFSCANMLKPNRTLIALWLGRRWGSVGAGGTCWSRGAAEMWAATCQNSAGRCGRRWHFGWSTMWRSWRVNLWPNNDIWEMPGFGTISTIVCDKVFKTIGWIFLSLMIAYCFYRSLWIRPLATRPYTVSTPF